jgi:hypothetical protein
MKLYDRQIGNSLALLSGLAGRRLAAPAEGRTAAIGGAAWPDAGEGNLILKGEMAYELGGGALPAIGGFSLTSSEALVDRDEILLYGPDLPDIAADSPYARLAFIRVAEDGLGEGITGAARVAGAAGADGAAGVASDGADAAYAAIRRIEYTRYHVNPKGYMMRVSVASEREPVRIGRTALAEGLDFAKVGGLFLSGYHAHPEVLAVKLVFVTLPGFPYAELQKEARQAETITRSLDRIFGSFVMNCASCELKVVCDEVEGMREMHFARSGRK